MKLLMLLFIISTISLNAMEIDSQSLIEAARKGNFTPFINLPANFEPHFIQESHDGLDIAMTAVANNQIAFLQCLLRKFDVRFRKDLMGRTAFSIATANNHDQCLEVLLQYNKTKRRRYPNFLSRSMALAKEYGSQKCINLLEDYRYKHQLVN